MKKIIFAVAAAVLALIACETIQLAEDPAGKPQSGVSTGSPGGMSCSSPDSILFTANLGVQSKTYLDYDGYGYKTLWGSGDQILIWDQSCFDGGDIAGKYEFCAVKDGFGTSTAKFVGTLEAETYVALYANNYYAPRDGFPVIYLPYQQQINYRESGTSDNNVSNGIYPMIAVSNSTTFDFQNLCSILKIKLTGKGETLDAIRLSSVNGEMLYGDAKVTNLGETDVLEFYTGGAGLEFVASDQSISSTPVECFIVVPAQHYASGLDITVFTDAGSKTVSTGPITTRRSRFYDISIDFTPDPMPDGVYLMPVYSTYDITPLNAHKWALKETSPGVYEKFTTITGTDYDVYTLVKWENGIRSEYAASDYALTQYKDYSYASFSLTPYDQASWYLGAVESSLNYVRFDMNAGTAVFMPTNWGLRGSFNDWGVRRMDNEAYSIDYVKYVVRNVNFTNPETGIKFDYSGYWEVNTDLGLIVTNLGDDGAGLCFDGRNIIVSSPGVYDVELTWTLTDGGLLDGFDYTVTRVGDSVGQDYSNCQLELVGTSVGEGNPDTSTWGWGNVLLAEYGGYPDYYEGIYYWYWFDVYLLDDATAESNWDKNAGFKIRTVNAQESGGIAYFDYGDGGIGAADFHVSQSGYYTVKFAVDPQTGEMAYDIW